jgi:hypothetical protein
MICPRAFVLAVAIASVASGAAEPHRRVVATLVFHSDSAKAGAAFGMLEAQKTASLMGVAFEATDHASAPLLTDLPPNGLRLTLTTAPLASRPPNSFLLAAHPDERATSSIEWHRSLRRFGAEQLNNRFQAHTGRPMDSEAWLAYMAVKILLESELRRGSRGLQDSIAAIRVDGHKGSALTFVDGRLRQPLYKVRTIHGKETVEEPGDER